MDVASVRRVSCEVRLPSIDLRPSFVNISIPLPDGTREVHTIVKTGGSLFSEPSEYIQPFLTDVFNAVDMLSQG